MPCSWEGSRRSGVAPNSLASQTSVVHPPLRAQGLRKGDSTPPALLTGYGTLPFYTCPLKLPSRVYICGPNLTITRVDFRNGGGQMAGQVGSRPCCAPASENARSLARYMYIPSRLLASFTC